MNELHAITMLLGEENEKKLRDGITELVLDYVKTDLENLAVYLLDWEEMFEEIRHEIKAAIKEKVKKKYLEAASSKIDEMVAKL